MPKRKPVERYYHSKEDDIQQFLICFFEVAYMKVSYNRKNHQCLNSPTIVEIECVWYAFFSFDLKLSKTDHL